MNREETAPEEDGFNFVGLIEKFTGTLENKSRNREFLSKLHLLSSEMAEFGLANEIKKFEEANFVEPEGEEDNLEKSRALDLHNIMRGLKVNADPSICFKFLKAMEIYTVKGLQFDLMDASVILNKKDQLYGKD